MSVPFTAANAITSAYDTTKNILSVKEHIPKAVWLMFGPLHHIGTAWHLWRIQREIATIIKPEHQSIVDAWVIRGAEGFLNQFQAIRVVAHLMLISHRITKCRQIMNDIGQTYIDLKAAFLARDLQQSLQHPQWIIIVSEGSCCSPSTYNWIASKTSSFSQSLYRIAVCIVKLFSDIFSLSMYFLDTVDAFFIDTSNPQHDVRIREVFENGIVALDQFASDQQGAIDFLVKEEKTARAILAQIGGGYTYDGLMTVLKTTKIATEGASAVFHFGGSAVSRFARNASEGAMSLLGLQSPVSV